MSESGRTREQSPWQWAVDLADAAKAMDATLQAVYDLDPEAHATKSRDYGRGFAEALRLVRAEIDGRMGAWAKTPEKTDPQP
jgi:hypothetical protein